MIIRANQPLENHMVLGPCYDMSGEDEGCCHFCGNVHNYDEMTEFYDGHVCDECATPCAICDDWLKDSPQVIVNGQCAHRLCAEEEGWLDDEKRQAAYDAWVDRRIEERKEVA